LEELMRSRDHPTAEDLYTRLKRRNPTMSLATVYKALELFKKMGLVNELGFASGSARYDPNVEPHINLICLKCGRIADRSDHGLHSIASRIGKNTDFRVLNQRFEFYGYCASCA